MQLHSQPYQHASFKFWDSEAAERTREPGNNILAILRKS